ncbi:type II secretion system F family protein [Proteiniclasticum sp. SCR006]|uniref:Type II secretion system F family protein n=1 Tax=Proteiniclasticum aestuarii TaxID=2817862 RepID=A0A939KLS5_9CLOT|nr:type II secretion system F family protein [Proteiniclasticum aestuarii]MBO1265980.1 type II secretion system F family protein [Proteiniclasticum aestuarii]
MEYIIITSVFITSILVFYALFYIFFQSRINLARRMEELSKIQVKEEPEDDLVKPFSERIIKPGYARFIKLINKVTPHSIKKKYEVLISQAGYVGRYSPSNIISMQVMSGILLASGAYLIGSPYLVEYGVFPYVFALFLGFYFPYSIINSNGLKRQKLVQRKLPDLLDLLFISVEAGLGFDMALKRATEKMQGPLSDEFDRALHEMSSGRSRQDAFRGIITRTGVEDVNTFLTAVIQSELLGTNIANTLRVQSNEMRQKRRQRAEEIAMKIPVKMLFPLVIFMLPALFIVILGPAGINMMESLGNM